MTQLAPHQQRVVDEKKELDQKLTALQAFWNSPIFEALPVDEKQRLLKQGGLMMGYSAVLKERIAAFDAPPASVTPEMVSRFLTWPVPAEVYPDGTPGKPGRTGTNLLSAQQATDMLKHVLGA